jgi:hypothetical protein
VSGVTRVGRDARSGTIIEVGTDSYRLSRPPAIDWLRRTSIELAQLTRRIGELVDLARSGGVSWSEIGSATGLTRQGAQQLWGTTAATS